MGQAKQRGTFQERQQLAKVRNAEEARLRHLAEQERLASMTPEQKEKQKEVKIKINQLLALALAAACLK